MATVDKTWTFASDNQGLADVGDTTVTVTHDNTGSGGAGTGSVEFLGASGATNTHERARRPTTGESWETWGVPAGSTVTAVEVVSFQARRWAGSATGTLAVRVVGSGGTSVHSAGDIASQSGISANGWVSFSGVQRAVDAGSQASTTDVRLELECTLSVANNTFDLGVDDVLVRITYTEGGGGTQVTAARSLSYDILNAVLASRTLNYDIFNTVSAARSLSYDILNAVLASRALNYDISNSVQAHRLLSYDILNAVLASRALSYDILAPGPAAVSVSSALNYDILAAVQLSSALAYDILNAVLASRTLNYDIQNNVARGVNLYYDLGNVIVATVAELVSSTRGNVWQPDRYTTGRRR